MYAEHIPKYQNFQTIIDIIGWDGDRIDDKLG